MLVDFNKTELEHKKISQLHYLDYMEIDLLLCNDIINHFDLEPLNFEFIGLGGGGI